MDQVQQVLQLANKVTYVMSTLVNRLSSPFVASLFARPVVSVFNVKQHALRNPKFWQNAKFQPPSMHSTARCPWA